MSGWFPLILKCWSCVYVHVVLVHQFMHAVILPGYLNPDLSDEPISCRFLLNNIKALFCQRPLGLHQFNLNNWAELRSACFCVIWHHCCVPCISSTYGCHITLDQVTLSTGFLGYSRLASPQHHVPAPVGRSQVSPGHVRHVVHNPSGYVKVSSSLDLSKNSLWRKDPSILIPKIGKNSAISVTKRPLWAQPSHGGLVFDACNLIFQHSSHATAAATAAATATLRLHTPHFQVTCK